ncbi:hypothetical protein ABIB50_001821 [Mucilaginibacter sp. UYCu711]
MKVVLAAWIILNVFFHIRVQAQSVNCKNFKIGTFKLIDKNHTTIIKRFGTTQKEYFDGAKIPTTYHVKWSDDCTYILIPSSDFFKKYPDTPKDARLTVHITKITNNRCTIVSSANFVAQVVTNELMKVR